MAYESRLTVRGLYSHPNQFSDVPQGALETADNIVIDREGVISPRRGFEGLEYNFATASDRANVLFEYQGKLIAQYGSSGLAYYDDATGWIDYSGSYSAPSGSRMRFAESNGNLYFTTSEGVKKLDAYNSTPTVIGVPQALGADATLEAGSWFTDQNQVAFKIVWGIRDANNNVVLGAPSHRIVVVNTSGSAKQVSLTVKIPDAITTAHFVQVYRSGLSGGAAIEPNDELQLVWESNPSSAEITAKEITIVDEQTVDVMGEFLYTNASQQTAVAENAQPPLAKDIAVFRDRLFFANTTGKHYLDLTLLGVGGTNGLADGDTIEIAGTVYTAKTTPVESTDFQLSSASSAAVKIQDTALALVDAVNSDSGNTSVYVFYVSGTDDLPGKLRIEEQGIGGSSFNVVVSNATAWNPDLSGSGKASTNDTFQNGLFYSKFQQPDAVPRLNYFRVGSANDAILRIMALRDSLLIFKAEGIFRLYSDGGDGFKIDLFDPSTRLLAPETLKVLNNQVLGLFDQGVCAVSDAGTGVESRPIERTLLELQGATLATVKSLAWAVTYESDRKYILHLPSRASDTHTTQAFVWNTFTKSWVRWELSKSCGIVRRSEDLLYLGDATSARVSKERKSYTFRDHVDEAVSVSISEISGLVVTISDVSSVAIGDVLYQSATLFSNITAVDPVASTVTVSYDPGFTVASASVLKAFTSTVKFVPFHAGAPLMSKVFRDCSLIFERQARDSAITFTTEIAKAAASVDVTGSSVGSWGAFKWGSVPWGGEVGSKVVRTWVTRNHVRANTLSVSWTHNYGYSKWALNGVQIVYEPVGERTTR